MSGTDNKRINCDILSKYRDEVYGISILWIMIFHGYLCEIFYFADRPLLKYVGVFLDNGNIGVEVFLFMSGICMYYSFYKDNDLIRFLKKRAKRIFPPLLISYVPFFLFQMVQGKISLTQMLFSLTTLRFWFTSTDTNWFISVILVCYIFYPYLYGIIFQKERGALFRTVIIVALMVLITFFIRQDAPDVYANIEIGLTRIPAFVLGCWFGKMVYDKRTFPKWALLPMIVSAVFCFTILKVDINHSMWRRYSYMLAGIPLTFIDACLVPYTGRYIRAILRFFGGISLELYLVHLMMKNFYVAGYFYTYVPGDVVRWLGVLLISIPLAFLVSLLAKKALKLIDNKVR